MVIHAPPSVSQIHITRAVPYELFRHERHRLFIPSQMAPPVLMCNDADGCLLDIKLSSSDLQKGFHIYQTEEQCHWALSGEAVEDRNDIRDQRDREGIISANVVYLCLGGDSHEHLFVIVKVVSILALLPEMVLCQHHLPGLLCLLDTFVSVLHYILYLAGQHNLHSTQGKVSNILSQQM